MNSLASRLVPEAVKKLIPYQSARRIGGIGHLWLNANELEQSCQYGELRGSYNRYPDFLPYDLAKAYKEYCGVNNEILAVRGADEAIDLLVRTFCQPGVDQIVVCPPTYGMYPFCADSMAVNTVKVPLLDNFQLDLNAIKQKLATTNILFLCSPNNPTGNLIRQQDIVTLLEAGKDSTLVVVDEAYIEFAPEASVVNLISDHPNLVVIRTLSKAFGLASIRCGFLIADPSVIEYVSRLIAPYPIADPTAEIALAALSPQGVEQMRIQTDTLISTREWFARELKALHVVEQVYPSSTNFVLVRFNPSRSIYEKLMSRGIVTRDQAHEPMLQDCVRISIGTKRSMLETLNNLQ